MAKNSKHGSFQSFYTAELLPLLTRLERKRKIRMLPYGVALLLVLPFLPSVFRMGELWLFLAVYGGALLGAARIFDTFFFRPEKMRAEVSRSVIPPLVNHALPNLVHRQAEYISMADFIDCGLFSVEFNRYSGRNCFVASGDKFNMSFSWLKVEHQAKAKNGRRSAVKTVFVGWCFVVYFRRHFTGATLILPDVAEARLGWFGRSVQEATVPAGMQLLLLEDAAFERHFKVLSTGQDDARHILTPVVMEEAARIASRLKAGMCISFLKNRMFVAVPVKGDFFDEMLTRSLINPAPLQELYQAVKGVHRLAGMVARHTKVWQ